MANIGDWLAKLNKVFSRIISLAILAACTTTCFVISASSQELEENGVENCTRTPVEICWYQFKSSNSTKSCDGDEKYSKNSKSFKVTSADNEAQFESEWSKCANECNSTKVVLVGEASKHSTLPAEITVAKGADKLIIFVKNITENNGPNKYSCSAAMKEDKPDIRLIVSLISESLKEIPNPSPSSSQSKDTDSLWQILFGDTLEVAVSRIIIIMVLVVFIYILFQRRCRPWKDRKPPHCDQSVVIPLERNIIPERKYTSNPTFKEYIDMDFTRISSPFPSPTFMNPSSTSLNFLNNTFTNFAFTQPSFTYDTLPKPRNSQVPIINHTAITHLQPIGEGFFGTVYKAELQVTTDGKSKTVAIKMLKQPASLEVEGDFMKEVEIMSSFKHPNIISLLGLCFYETLSAPWMIFEYMSQGDLAGVLRKLNPQTSTGYSTLPLLPQETLVSIALHISKGMEYLASQKFVHRDLACRNCLVGENFIVKISDFGMSRDVHERDYYKVNGCKALPVRWMAPESIEFGTFTLASDVWSFGVVLWEIYNYGRRPYYGHCNEEVLKLVVDGHLLSIPSNCPPVVANIMRACWEKYIEDRITFSEICQQLSHFRDSILYQNISVLRRPPTPNNSTRRFGRNAYRENDMDNLMNEFSDYLTPILTPESVPPRQKEFRMSKRFLVTKSRLFSKPYDRVSKAYNNTFETSSRQSLTTDSETTKF